MEIDELINSLQRRPAATAKASTRLKKAWVAERMAPEVREFARADVEAVVGEIKQLIAYIDEHSFEIENSANRDVKITLLVVETELERLKYLVRAYLRARISKIERHIVYYSNPNHQHNLSTQEAEYAFSHFQLQFNLYQSSFMGSWPQAYQDLQSDSSEGLVDAPSVTKPVVVKVLKDSVLGAEPVRAGEIWMTPYSVVREYLEGDMELV